MASVVFDVTLAGNNPWDLLYLAGGDPYHMEYDPLTKTLTDNTITQAALDQAVIDLIAGVVSPAQQIIATESALTLITISDLAMAIAGDSIALAKIITSVGAVPNTIPPIPSSISTKHAFSETVDPLSTDDSNSGFAKSSLWINTLSDKIFICLDSSASSAVWHRIDVTSVTLDGSSKHISRNNKIPNNEPTISEIALAIAGDTAIIHLSDGKTEYWSNNGSLWTLDFTQTPTVLDGNRVNLTRSDSLIGVKPSNSEISSPINGDTAVVFLLDGTVEYWNYDGVVWVLANSMRPIVLDGNAHYIVRSDYIYFVRPTANEIPSPLNGDTAIVFLSNTAVEYWEYIGTTWVRKHIVKSKVAINPPLAATSLSGHTGVSELFAKEDHTHPLPGVSSDLNNVLSLGSDDLPYSPPPIPLDGSNYNIVRPNSNRGISPTLLEVPSPINGDTAIAFLLDKGTEYWSYSVSSWILIHTSIYPASTSNPLPSIGSIGSIGDSDLFAREDHIHPSQGISSDADNELTIGSDGLVYSPNVILDGTTKHVNRVNNTRRVSPTLLEVPSPINGDTAIVFLLDNVVEFWCFCSNFWTLDHTHALKLSTTIPPRSNDSIGGVGASGFVARQDHKHPAQGVSSDANNSIAIGSDGLHFLKTINADGRMIYIQRLNTDHSAPSLIEVAEPIKNDTSIVFLSDGVKGFWIYDGISWVLIFTDENHRSIAIPLKSADGVGSVGSSTLFAREDHTHPTANLSSDKDNLLKLGSDGLLLHTHRLDNLSGIKNPTPNDDGLIGYTVGSVWFNIKNANAFVCVFAAPHSAVWMLLTPDSVPEFKFRTKQPIIEGTDLKSTKTAKLIDFRNLFNASAETGIDIDGVRIPWTLETINNIEFGLRLLQDISDETVFIRDSNGTLLSFDKDKSKTILKDLRIKYYNNLSELYILEQKVNSETDMLKIDTLEFIIK